MSLQIDRLKREYDSLGPYIDSCSRAAEDLEYANKHTRLKLEIWNKLCKLGVVLNY